MRTHRDFDHNPARRKDRVPSSEQLIMDALGEEPVSSALCTSLGRGQLAAAVARRWPNASVVCHFLDLYRANQAERAIAESGAEAEVVCTPTLPDSETDLVAIPCTAQGDGELTRDLLQDGFSHLKMGGRLIASSDNPRDTWLGEVLERFFRKVTRTQTRRGVVYAGVKTEPLNKVKNYSCQFAFRDGPTLIHIYSLPGVFSHRRLDGGARALMNAMDVRDAQRIVDIGCGSGTVSLAAALRAPTAEITAIDSNPRAIVCTQRSAELNGVQNIKTILNADADCEQPGTFDVALANPPYYSNFRIGEIFVDGAERALKPGGKLFLVTKRPDVYLKLLETGFRDTVAISAKGYSVLLATR